MRRRWRSRGRRGGRPREIRWVAKICGCVASSAYNWYSLSDSERAVTVARALPGPGLKVKNPNRRRMDGLDGLALAAAAVHAFSLFSGGKRRRKQSRKVKTSALPLQCERKPPILQIVRTYDVRP